MLPKLSEAVIETVTCSTIRLELCPCTRKFWTLAVILICATLALSSQGTQYFSWVQVLSTWQFGRLGICHSRARHSTTGWLAACLQASKQNLIQNKPSWFFFYMKPPITLKWRNIILINKSVTRSHNILWNSCETCCFLIVVNCFYFYGHFCKART